ncbi:MAG: hypothetical protein M3349_04765, partial [Actinomycetota bacterium]|nr:hypothetical protein [Actinomycetota bacterium]
MIARSPRYGALVFLLLLAGCVPSDDTEAATTATTASTTAPSGIHPNGVPRVVVLDGAEEASYELEALHPPEHSFTVHVIAETEDGELPDIDVRFVVPSGRELFILSGIPESVDLADGACTGDEARADCMLSYPVLGGQCGPVWT